MSKYSDDFRVEIKKGFLDAVGSMADYRIRLDAGGWVDKNVLTEEDYLEICRAVEAQYIEPPVAEDETIKEGEISADDIAGGVIEETETEVEESQTETEIIEDSTNEEEFTEGESTNDETEPEAEPTEKTE